MIALKCRGTTTSQAAPLPDMVKNPRGTQVFARAFSLTAINASFANFA
ncbi:MAG TPA: hypothetical protein VGE69_11190 [Pseudomonadales bacterium]